MTADSCASQADPIWFGYGTVTRQGEMAPAVLLVTVADPW